jgi:uncharacterized protein (DUF2147 family)
MKTLPLALSLLIGAFLSPNAVAQASPIGLWQSIDDASGQPRAQIRVSAQAGALVGVIEKSSVATDPKNPPRCTLCTDDRKDQPMLGMQIIRGIKPASSDGVWSGGQILDPDKGKTYRLELRLLEDGKAMQVRGHVGVFFRNQVWKRLE